MPIRTMLNDLSRRSVAVGQHADLTGDLARREVAHEPHLAGETEVAVHRAADLAGDAERLPRRVGDEDRLDALAVGELKQELPRAVGRARLVHQLRRGDDELLRQLRAQLDWQIRHQREVGDALAVDPAEDLLGAELRQSRLAERLFHGGKLHVGEIGTGAEGGMRNLRSSRSMPARGACARADRARRERPPARASDVCAAATSARSAPYWTLDRSKVGGGS